MSAPDLLRAIVAGTRRIVETRRQREPLPPLAARAAGAAPRGEAFRAALGRRDRVNVIAECKRRSPAKGVLVDRYDPAAMAAAYERGGAAAVSVLTEPTFFDGSLADLAAVRAAVSLPVLRKDFIVDEYQLLEARAHGADAVLLIVAVLEDRELTALLGRARDLGLAALVEVHDERELRRAVEAGAAIVGVNNRNLRTLAVDLEASHRLAPLLPQGVVAVSESGLRTRTDVERLRSAGYHAFLVGERVMTDGDPARVIGGLVGAPVS